MSKNGKQPFDLTGIRDRVVELRRMYPRELKDHPGQWREHTEAQAGAMVGVLQQIGQAGALLAWRSEREGGALCTFDGHLRKALDPGVKWPVLITDLNDEEADFALATHDPLTMMAMADKAALDALLSSVSSDDARVQAMLAELAERELLKLPEFKEYDESVENEVEYITCPNCGHKWPK